MNTQRFKQSILACTISALCSQYTLAETGNAFIDDASVSGRIRTVYYRIENTEVDSKDNANLKGAWTGALWVDLKSGYFNDVFAVGASAYGVSKFDTFRYDASNQLLLDGDKGFGKLGQAWADLKFGNDDKDISGHVKVGRQIIYTGLISSSGSRSAPTTWQGVNFESSIHNTSFKAAWVNEIMLRNDDEFRELQNFNNQKIDSIWGAELGHKFQLPKDNSLKLKYRNAFSKDFLQAHNVDVKWTMPINDDMDFSLNGKVYYAKKDGDLWNGEAWYATAFDDDATVTNLTAELTKGPWTFEAAVTKTKADSSKTNAANKGYIAPSKYYYDYGKNTHGIWDIPTSGFAEDFFYDNELAWTVGANVDMTEFGVPGLKLGYAFIQGSGIEVIEEATGKKEDTKESEHDFLVQYAFPDPLKGLKFKLKYGLYRNDEALRKAINKEENDLRVWLDYNFVLF